MPTKDNPNLLAVDWSKIPAPTDDGAARHLEGMVLPDLELAATDATRVSLCLLPGRVVVFAYPRTGRPGEPALVDDWDQIPGARGCTPDEIAGQTLLKRLAMIIDDGKIAKVFYPVFPPDRNASEVLAWLKRNLAAP